MGKAARRGWLAHILIVAGLLLMSVPLAQKGVSALAQSRLRAAYSQTVDYAQEVPAAIEAPTAPLPGPLPGDVAVVPGGGPAEEEAVPDPDVARIIIPSIGVDAIVVDGTSPWDLAQGPGFYPEGSRPDEGGNVAIAGHRTTYGAWFRHLDQLEPGDVIELVYAGQVYHYEVERVWPIANNDWSVIAPTGDHVLTLTTCHPPGSSRQRLVVRARWSARS